LPDGMLVIVYPRVLVMKKVSRDVFDFQLHDGGAGLDNDEHA
jgi:hypothetical protein